ncbi:flagellar biosynthesis protein FlhA [Aurantiacibacter atlanticus]|uniref:Flagellar biosynthesis protein FlhA n=2 Tax=Aurantiacibacter atlanticus TaxID=1648404 RepID=A0A0H4W0Y6_9SPHN|nr:flagellar biosynthesis protein FlhA [Aurantiacibacter atlanticus]AKQ43173.2 flagellar biosynthesis protein FlhA [Aurantiacibacter atlanticus]
MNLKLPSNLSALALPAGILALIAMMVLPIPTVMLDIFFVFNIALSIGVLMAALYAAKPLDFSAFPTVLLFATLLRLALNVASTRIVLVNGHEGEGAAGQVIESFGAFLVGGNFAVGLFVFIILLIINLVVITKGAGRVSEVSARFTLDALPGKQMAIDADIAAGLMTAQEAKARRVEVSTEADFYGAMDGASKFVKGDAIAAMLILAVNIFAGIGLGMIGYGMSASQAAETFITLAVGDALVAQVPALLLSIAAAAIVTRVADASDLVGQIGRQFSNPASWLPVALVLFAMGMIPAMPQMVFLPAAALAFWLYRTLKKKLNAPIVDPVEDVLDEPQKIAIADVSDHTLVTLEMGYGLVHLVDDAKGAPLVTRVTGVRKQLSQTFGFVVPQFRIRDSLELPANEYRIMLGGVELARAEARPDAVLAIDTGEVSRDHGLHGQPTTDPSFGCPAIWIAPAEKDHAVAEGFLTVSADTVIATHLNHLLQERAQQLLGPEEVRSILDAVKERAPGLVEATHPDPLSLAAITRMLRALLADGISLAHPVPILSSLALGLQITKDFDALVDYVRADLGGWLVGQVCPPTQALGVLTLDAELEGAILGGMKDPVTGQPVIEPDCARMIGDAVADHQARHSDRGLALIVQPPARRALAALLRQRAPTCLVLSITELPPSQSVEVIGVIGGRQETPAPPQLPDASHEEVLAA